MEQRSANTTKGTYNTTRTTCSDMIRGSVTKTLWKDEWADWGTRPKGINWVLEQVMVWTSLANRDSEILKKVKEKLRDTPKRANVIITVKELKRAIARMSNWKAAGPDHVQGFWFKKATSLHPKLKQHLQECVHVGAIPTWMTEGHTILIMKDKSKGTVVGNYRPIACLPLMWKLFTSIFSEAMYGHCQLLGIIAQWTERM